MISFNRFVVAASVGMLGMFASQWASADELTSAVHLACEQEAREQALLVDDVDEGDIASYVEGCEVERLASHEEDRTNEYLAHLASMADVDASEDVDAYNLALRDVAAAPAFCAVTWVERDVTRGWVAHCDLVGEGDPSELRCVDGECYPIGGAP